MTHVLDDLELYAVGALPAGRSQDVARHLRECATCGAAAAEIDELVALLPDAAPPREPPAALKARVLAVAAEEARRERRRLFRLPRLLPDPRVVALAAAAVLLVGLDVNATIRLQEAQAERDRYAAMLERISHGGRWWYMAGTDQWRGTGGNLVAPGTGGPAFVLFHDLRALPVGQFYALWLISPDGGWVRGASFRPEAEMQLVEVGMDIAGYERCAVTVETSVSGRREGPIVMQSRIAPPR